MRYPLSHSDIQKRIEKETNTNLTKELAGLVGESFLEAAKPQVPKEPLEECRRFVKKCACPRADSAKP